MTSGRLAALSLLICIGTVAAGSRDVPRPATVVLDRDGVVRWVSLSDNYQVRPDPHDVVRALRAL